MISMLRILSNGLEKKKKGINGDPQMKKEILSKKYNLKCSQTFSATNNN